MKLNSSAQRTIADSLEAKCGLKLTEENLKNFRLCFKRRLKQFHLDGIYEPDEVLNEAVIRLIKALQEGKKVPIPEAWIKNTGFKIVHELSRKQKKYQTVEPTTLESVTASDEEISLALEKQEESERVYEALKELKSEEQELLRLQFFEGLSCPQIALHLAQRGQQHVSPGTLRKKKERTMKQLQAIESLREVYFNKFL